jgi:hypothetical protein
MWQHSKVQKYTYCRDGEVPMLVEIGTMRRTGGGRNQEERRETWSEEMGSGGGEDGGVAGWESFRFV